jgi:hypothetical protein
MDAFLRYTRIGRRRRDILSYFRGKPWPVN